MKPSVPVLLLAAASVIAGCAAEPIAPAPPPQPVMPDTTVYFYPTAGRKVSPDRQDRDKYECNAWAVKQTGFDPSEPQVPTRQRVRIVEGGPPPGAQVGAGAFTGAVVGAAVSSPWETGRGAVIGGLAGAAIAGIAAAEHNDQVRDREAAANARANQAVDAKVEHQAIEFRRAIGACLEGRGYSVR